MNARIIWRLLRVLLGAGFVIPTQAQVAITDSGLITAIRAALLKSTGPLTQEDLLSLTNLDASRRGVKSIAGLEAARNLVSLDLQSNQLTRLTLPPGLTQLSTLVLSDNQLTDLTLPPDMTNLDTLALEGNRFATFVLSEPMAATQLALVAAALRGQGVPVFTYPLEVQLLRPRAPIGAFGFGIAGPPGTYSVLGSTDLASWTELGVTTIQTGRINFTDVTAHFSPRKFYRALRQVASTNITSISTQTHTKATPAVP